MLIVNQALTVAFPDTDGRAEALLGAHPPGPDFDHATQVMGSTWDGRERRRGHSHESSREHLRQLREVWEAIQRDTHLKRENENEKPTLAVQGDNDEERCARVEAMLETLRPTGKPARKLVVRSKTPSSRRVGYKR